MTESKYVSDTIVAYKGIIHERTEDAPFMGALIIGTSCSLNCQNCFNQHLKVALTYHKKASNIILEVLENPFNAGIILAGLEWSEQANELQSLVYQAKQHDLEVIVYTGLNEEEFHTRVPREILKGCYVKYGKYDCTKVSTEHTSFKVRLASTNQYVKFMQ